MKSAPMKSGIAGVLPFWVVGASLLLTMSGCGGTNAEMAGAEYPPPPEPVGYNAPPAGDRAVAASEGPQVAPQKDPQLGEAQEQYAPQPGDIAVGESGTEYTDTDPAALADFRQPLEPYGTWADDGQYGTVWTPASTVVGPEFSPYVTAGHWTYDNEYTWVSDYDWGWAPFHYGRWVYIGGRGWSWIPGRTYSGAWVTWRAGYNDWGYVGWAPLPPTWYWRGGYAVGIGYVPVAPYVFCSNTHLFHPGVGAHIVTGSQVGIVASHTRPYVPANPSVGGGVAGGGHLPARPTVGPPPGQLGLAAGSIPHAPLDNRSLTRAQQFASPTTAQSIGARPPQTYAQSVAAAPGPHAYSANGHSFVGQAPRMSSPTTLGRGDGPVATSPQYRGISPTPYRAPTPSSSPYASPYTSSGPTPYSPSPVYRAPSPSPYVSGPSSQPTFRAPTYSPPSQSFRSVPTYSAPAQSYHAPTPSFRSSPSAPTFSAPTQSFRPSVPSAPTFSAPRSAAPTFSRPSSGGGFQGARRR